MDKMSPAERRTWYESLDRRNKLLADLRALADAPGHTATIVSLAADELEMAWGRREEKSAQADENDALARGGPDGLLKAKACVALLNSAALLRQ